MFLFADSDGNLGVVVDVVAPEETPTRLRLTAPVHDANVWIRGWADADVVIAGPMETEDGRVAWAWRAGYDHEVGHVDRVPIRVRALGVLRHRHRLPLP